MENQIVPSTRWQLNKEDLTKIVKVFGWTMGASAIGFIIMVIPQVDIPAGYALVASLIIPVINTGLVALQKFMAGKLSEK